jgi:two-component system cell cycle response regulator CtrA
VDKDDRIAALEAYSERLRDRIDALEAALGMTITPWVGLGLTPTEARLFGLLVSREQATKAQMLAAIEKPGADDAPEIKIVDVLVCKVRKKIALFGLSIETVWGHGYRMPPLSRERAKALIERAAA